MTYLVNYITTRLCLQELAKERDARDGEDAGWGLFLLDYFAMVEIENALIAATPEFKGKVALRHNEWAIYERIELLDEFPCVGIARYLFVY